LNILTFVPWGFCSQEAGLPPCQFLEHSSYFNFSTLAIWTSMPYLALRHVDGYFAPGNLNQKSKVNNFTSLSVAGSYSEKNVHKVLPNKSSINTNFIE
jgi:hypothetical protein